MNESLPRRRLQGMIAFLVVYCSVLGRITAAEPVIEVWLLPAERALNSDVTDVTAMEREMDAFRTNGVPAGVILDNISDPILRTQLLAWNPEFAMPNLGWVRGQIVTLRALGRFARVHRVQVRVRFHTWGNAFVALKDAAREKQLPDVAQVGSSWVAQLGHEGALRPCLSQSEGEIWRSIPGMPCAALQYTTDVRVIYYWQKLPTRAKSRQKPLVLDSSSWPALVETLRLASTPPMVFPTGLTYNVMHDLLPVLASNPERELFTINRWSRKITLIGQGKLDTAKLLAKNAVVSDAHGLPRRILAFPEVTHEEAIRFFESGGYAAIIEPAGYLSRWRESFRQQRLPGDFWDYAGVAAPPPGGFLGGSDLAVLRNQRNSDLAFELARFLAIDPEYTEMLARLGNVTAHSRDRSLDTLIDSIAGPDRPDIVRQFSREIRLALSRGREYPALPDWATEVENRTVLESMQRVWRRIAEGSPDRVELAVADLEQVINSRIDPLTRARERVRSVWLEFSVALLLVMVTLLSYFWRRAKMLDHVRKIRGFSVAGLSIIDGVHRCYQWFRGGDVSERDAQKAAIIAVGLVGLRRGRRDASWQPDSVKRVAWRGVVLALDSVWDATTSRRWQDNGSDPEFFLAQNGLLRPTADFSPGEPPFYFTVDCTNDAKAALPFLLEQATMCLLQNALKASLVERESGEAFYLPVVISVSPAALTITNRVNPEAPRPLSPKLCELINSSRSLDEFERGVQRLLDGPLDDRPGIGLVEAYFIAAECFHGLSVHASPSDISFSIGLRRPGLLDIWTRLRPSHAGIS